MDIRTFRQSKGLTLAALGDAIGVTKGYLSQIENGARCSQHVALQLEKFSEGAIDAAAISEAVMAARSSVGAV